MKHNADANTDDNNPNTNANTNATNTNKPYFSAFRHAEYLFCCSLSKLYSNPATQRERTHVTTSCRDTRSSPYKVDIKHFPGRLAHLKNVRTRNVRQATLAPITTVSLVDQIPIPGKNPGALYTISVGTNKIKQHTD